MEAQRPPQGDAQDVLGVPLRDGFFAGGERRVVRLRTLFDESGDRAAASELALA